MELDPCNREAVTALAHTRSLLGRSSASAGPGGGFTFPPSVNAFLDRAKQLGGQGLTQALLFWGRLSTSHKQLAGAAVVALVGYWMFFSGRGGSYGYDSYDSGRYGGGGMLGRGGGMSWTVWGALMAAGYYLPPMFPDVLGPEVSDVTRSATAPVPVTVLVAVSPCCVQPSFNTHTRTSFTHTHTRTYSHTHTLARTHARTLYTHSALDRTSA